MLRKFLAFFLLTLPMVSWSQTAYVVKPGDTVLKVADRVLGNKERTNPKRYELARKIRQMNPDLKNPNALEPGQTLMIPGPGPMPKAAPAVQAAKPPHSPIDEPAQPVAKKTAPAAVEEYEVPAIAHQPAVETLTPEAKSQNSGHHEAGHSDFIFLQPRYQTLEIATKEVATGAKASMKSKSSVGLDIQYGKILTDHWHLLFQAGLTQTQFEGIEGAGATVNHTSEILKYFAAGIAYEATSSLHLDLMLMSAERTFLLPATLPAYELKAIAVPAAELNVSYDFYSGTSNIFGISGIAEYLAKFEKDSVEYKSALETFGALYWKSKYGHDSVNYKVTLTYKHGHQDTTVSQQNEDMTALGVGFYF